MYSNCFCKGSQTIFFFFCRLLGIEKLSVVGGHLDSRCDVAGVREKGGLELRVMLLTNYGKVCIAHAIMSQFI